jgi:hypothetical protein
MNWPGSIIVDPNALPHYLIGLGPEDAALLREHARLHDLPPGECHLYTHVGPSPLDPSEQPQTDYPPLADNYRRRVDLIIDDGETAHINEIKPAASYVALGQILYYTYLIRKYLNPACALVPTILTDCPDPDIICLCDQHGIAINSLPGMSYEPRGRPT